MKETVEVALAAFLHDWGKLLQRGRVSLTEQADRMKEMLCPSPRGYHSHLHVLWTNDFIENHTSWLPGELDRARISRLASHHHRPSDAEDFLISEADRLASGHDRRPATEVERENFRRVPLLSIFNQLSLRKQELRQVVWHRPTQLFHDERFMPMSGNQSDLVEKDYSQTAKEFLERADSWQAVDLARCCDAASYLSESFLGYVPASTIDVADVSLHDHSTLVAAFASALYAFHRETDTISESSITNRTAPKFRLVTGDLSGIQKYLFDMPDESRKGIARTYRARSFYLSMLTHAATLLLLDQLNLTRFNRVIDAGGRFILLIPDLPSSRDAVAGVAARIESWLLKRHAGRVTLNLSVSDALCGNDFMGEQFLATFERARRDAETIKSRMLRSSLLQGDAWDESAQCLNYVHSRQASEAAMELDVQTGRHLPNANYFGLWNGSAPVGLLEDSMNVLGLELQLFKDPPTQYLNSALDFFGMDAANKGQSSIITRSIANYVPKVDQDDLHRLSRIPSSSSARDSDEEGERRVGQLMTFGDLAAFARSERNGAYRGQPAIACLKADVDRLGMLFSHGFGKNVAFGRYATLSRQLDLFFKGFLENKLSDQESPYRLVYTVFSGGDDLMLVGPWHIMFNLAVDLRKWFSKLAGNNPDVTLSAGLALGQSRIPISLLAEAAELQLGNAKSSGRNRVGAFNGVFNWPEFAEAIESGRRLERLVLDGDQKGNLPIRSTFVYRLLQYAKMAEKVRSARDNEAVLASGRPLSPRSLRLNDLRGELTWRSHLQYDLRRNVIERARNTSDEARQDLEWLQSLLCIDAKPQDTQKLKLATTYALYRNRGG
ncbi:MAG: type III-A CRISPR-associated protein Cas10/Csm1 [Phycisphaerales bacterium]|nr:type III-A CRISPR-associated protein Cas10/Csm1 [Phycisphaerales bacterium]MCB9855318.1 type III-A CRISPR-associated protein Cas10/Csm1 [Phycisphaerales bacterium]MCB9862911.1 type III-A CRISPR-associated protein Cas10/Csm1 [Phycisphaerales bacterium]